MDTQSLRNILCTFFDWHPARITTFAELILAVVKARTLRLKELALHVTSKTDRLNPTQTSIVKIERFLFWQEIDMQIVAFIIVHLLNLPGKIRIAIDRTNWQYGKQNLNFLVASIIYKNISIPVVWIMLDKKGNSSNEERIELTKKLLQIIPANKIAVIVADREFASEEWMMYLQKAKIPFGLRLKKSEQITHVNGGKMKFDKYFSGMKKGDLTSLTKKMYDSSIEVKITCLQLETEQLILASNIDFEEDILLAYKDRWSIERSFKALKTSGFNMEDTHITDLGKLEKIFSMAAIALCICVIAGDVRDSFKPIKVKKHGRKAYSVFTYGFDLLRNFFTINMEVGSYLAEIIGAIKTRIQMCFEQIQHCKAIFNSS